LGEGRPDNVAGQVLHGRIIVGRDAVAAEDVEAGMPPRREHGNHLLRESSSVQEHPEHLVPENGLQLFQLQRWSDAEHPAIAIETAVGHQDMAVGIESEKIAEGLDSDDGAGDGIVFMNRILEKDLQGFPGAAAEIGKKLSIVEEVTAEDFRYAEDEMTVGNLLEDIHAEPLSEFHHAFLVAGWAEMAPLAGECEQIFVAAIFTFHAGKAVVQITAIEITIDYLLDIRPPETVLPGEMFIVDLDKGLKIVLDTAVVIRILLISWAINGGRGRHDLSPLRISCRHNAERTFYLSRVILLRPIHS
jgi:hypothetical protein